MVVIYSMKSTWKVTQTLKLKDTLKNSVIIVTGDRGEKKIIKKSNFPIKYHEVNDGKNALWVLFLCWLQLLSMT